MPSFSARSLDRLLTTHSSLIRVFKQVVVKYDCTILEGLRSYELQQLYYDQGKSKILPGQSWHNGWKATDDFRLWKPDPKGISLAVDVAPYPIDWNDIPRFQMFGHYVLGVADGMGVNLRWGGDWNRNWDLKDQAFHDLPHFELANVERVSSTGS